MRTKKEVKKELKNLVEEVNSMEGKMTPLQMIRMGSQEFNFYGTQKEFFELLKDLQFGKFKKMTKKEIWMYCTEADVTLHKQIYIDEGSDDDFDIEIGFKSKEMFSASQISKIKKLEERFEKLEDEYKKLTEKEKVKSKLDSK